MTRRTKAILAAVAAVASIGAGSAALASASGRAANSDPPDHAQQQQSGADTEHGAGARDGTAERGSEVPGGDGPGGHADEPGDSNADHEARGAE